MELAKIREEVQAYIENQKTYPYALMLEGPWGSGKTWFMKDIIEGYVGKLGKPRGIYVSLYGLTSAGEITTMLLTSIHRAKYGTITLPIADIVAEKVSKLIEEKVGQSFSEYCRERQGSATFSKNDYFFVFDDLERCPMPLDEVMGYISNFVEQYEAKVILIGNEEEIEQNFSRLPEFYQIALNSEVEWPEFPDPGAAMKKAVGLPQSQEKPALSLDLLEKRMELVGKQFHPFSRVKEKIVGRTIRFAPSELSIYDGILTDERNKEWVSAIWKSDEERFQTAQSCLFLLSQLKHQNLRTFQFALDVFKHCYADFSSSLKNEEYYSEFCSNWLLTILRVSCYYKMGLEDVDWSKKKEIDSVEFQEGNKDIWSQLGRELTIGSAFTSVKVIHDYIFRSIYSKESVEQASLQYYSIFERAQLDSTDPLKVDLGDYYIQKEEQVVKGIQNVEKRLYSGKYRPEQYHKILGMFCGLRANGFDIDLDKCVTYMKNCLSNGGQLFEWPGEEVTLYKHYSELDGFDLFKKCIEELKVINGPNQMKLDIEFILSKKEGWGKKLREYVVEKFAYTGMPYSKVISCASSQKWTDMILSGEAIDIDSFRGIVLDRREVGSAEANILWEIRQNVQNKLDHDPPQDKIIAMQFRWLVNNIESKLGPSNNA